LVTANRDREYLLSELGKAFLKTSAFRIGDFKTAKGTKTPYYVDLSRVTSFPNVFSLAVECLELELAKISKTQSLDSFCGIPLTGLLFCAVMAEKHSKPLVHAPLNQEHKIIGVISPGSNTLIVDDVSETGSTIKDAAGAIRANGGVVTEALTLIDRSEGAREDLQKLGISLQSFTTVHELARKLKDNMALSEDEENLLENDSA